MTEKRFSAIIFDMDGVLVDTEPHHTIIEERLFASLNLDISKEEHATYLGKSSLQMWKEIINIHNLSETPEYLAQKNSEEIERYFTGPGEINLMPGIKEVLEELCQQTIPIALASSSDIKTIEILLTRTGLKKYFLHKVSSETVGKSKPDPVIYLYTAELLAVKPEECIVIEDSSNGIKAAKNAGMYCIAYKRLSDGTSGQSDADETITDFSDMPDILRRFKML